VKIVGVIPEIQNAVSSFVKPDLKLDIPCRELFYNHRIGDNASIYYLINLSDQLVERTITFSSTGNMESWNPLNGEILRLSITSKGSNTSMKIRLEPFESKIMVFNK
jgi:hypothetical protein